MGKKGEKVGERNRGKRKNSAYRTDADTYTRADTDGQICVAESKGKVQKGRAAGDTLSQSIRQKSVSTAFLYDGHGST